MIRQFGTLVFFVASVSATAQNRGESKWVDSLFSTLSVEEKIGQLVMLDLSGKGQSAGHESTAKTQPFIVSSQVYEQIENGKIGGVFISRIGILAYAKTVNQLQARANIPLLIGPAISNHTPSLLDSMMVFYDSLVVAAIPQDSLKTRLLTEQERQLRILTIRPDFRQHLDSINGLKRIDVGRLLSTPKKKRKALAKQAFLDGNYFFIAPASVDAAIKYAVKIVKNDKPLAAHLEKSVKKILAMKCEAGLSKKKRLDTDNLFLKLHTPEAALLKQKLAEAAVTLLQNDSEIIPIQKLDNRSFASLSLGEGSSNEFTRFLSKYVAFSHFSVALPNDTIGLSESLKDKEVIIVGLFPSASAWAPGISSFISRLSLTHKVIVSSFANPGDLNFFEKSSALIAAYSDADGLPQAAAEIIFGGIAAQGKLPIKISDSLSVGQCIKTKLASRFAYTLPEDAGMSSAVLKRIERVAEEAISIGAVPGCQVLVAKDGKVVYQKSFGWLTYDRKIRVSNETIYDLASVTKVSATLQAVMYLQEKGLIDLNKKASVYLPELKKTNKEDFTIKDIITHQAGLWPYLPFWLETVKDTTVFKKYYHATASEAYPFPVAEKMFAARFMKDSLWQWIIKAKVRDKPFRSVFDYRYSDMGFYIMQHLNEKLLGQPQEKFLQSKIYNPLGATTTGYLPLRKFSAAQIAPTENDTTFRKSLLVGYVHDQGAAMHGGIAGHAGLFSDANDLAKLGQMWLNRGSYGGIQFFKPETLDLFTARQYEDSRRGLGWDKPLPSDASSPTSRYASARTFGHTGFTGTCIWVDPEFNLVYVFLSNRVNPDMNNTKLLNANIRPRIQEIIYQSIFEYCKNHPSPETK